MWSIVKLWPSLDVSGKARHVFNSCVGFDSKWMILNLFFIKTFCLLLSNRSGILHCKCVTVTTTMNVSSTSTGLLFSSRSLLNPATFLLLTVHYEVFNFVWLRRFSELKLARWHSRPLKSTARASVNHKAATEYQFGIQSQQHPSWIVIISFVCLKKP